MAVKGQESKKVITEKIIEVFEGAFINGKELRVPLVENGEPIEIKITLTAAKDCLKSTGDSNEEQTVVNTKTYVEPSQDELNRMEQLFASLG